MRSIALIMYGLSIILVGCSKPKVIEINEAELLDNIKYLSKIQQNTNTENSLKKLVINSFFNKYNI